MNRQQKRTLAILISISAALILAIAAVVTRHVLQARSLSILLVFSVAATACAGAVVFFRLRPRQGTVMFDERDREIQRNASLSAFGSVFFFLMLASFATAFILGEKASIPVTCLPLIVAGAGIFYAYAFFVSLVIQYGRPKKGEGL